MLGKQRYNLRSSNQDVEIHELPARMTPKKQKMQKEAQAQVEKKASVKKEGEVNEVRGDESERKLDDKPRKILRATAPIMIDYHKDGVIDHTAIDEVMEKSKDVPDIVFDQRARNQSDIRDRFIPVHSAKRRHICGVNMNDRDAHDTVPGVYQAATVLKTDSEDKSKANKQPEKQQSDSEEVHVLSGSELEPRAHHRAHGDDYSEVDGDIPFGLTRMTPQESHQVKVPTAEPSFPATVEMPALGPSLHHSGHAPPVGHVFEPHSTDHHTHHSPHSEGSDHNHHVHHRYHGEYHMHPVC